MVVERAGALKLLLRSPLCCLISNISFFAFEFLNICSLRDYWEG